MVCVRIPDRVTARPTELVASYGTTTPELLELRFRGDARGDGAARSLGPVRTGVDPSQGHLPAGTLLAAVTPRPGSPSATRSCWPPTGSSTPDSPTSTPAPPPWLQPALTLNVAEPTTDSAASDTTSPAPRPKPPEDPPDQVHFLSSGGAAQAGVACLVSPLVEILGGDAVAMSIATWARCRCRTRPGARHTAYRHGAAAVDN